ncbi:siderophore ABC transporter substrate-binding protein [Ketogulonicigenium vulgare]|uniref:ABC transporter, substrate-binding protein n=1 Tax=Ketogulonicigenium vulgare (strain WSH-001) TaxID=759362 RepID=F9YAF0_KETVW|nr:ABC transporter substrate-binding protein [Ketogulonicigenium vulgare]ADO42115.1 ABC transporter, substrate binding protein [Ketogulonicigenium vulgare Y25]AEM40323.1 ABC transporter, substrate-binding protein [Ketogulonicigenium vulgare WSH-001]ALJ82266.1 iron ABC transporter substrate-binding protein [Ketogulonicigenium vulgare]ANW33344.1 iron ABC transporter substrate-binding protein [Ketogulonicigenium vulgare]AOZ54035.1 ABC transporter substrate-binding protein [Ketogulonicigenium vulg
MNLRYTLSAASIAMVAALPAFAQSVTIPHAQGELTLDAAPEKVLVMDINTLDNFVALGLTPAGVPKGNLHGPAAVFDTDEFINVGTLFEPDLEAINAAEADLMIVASRSARAYPAVSEIVPTIDLSFDSGKVFEDVSHNLTLLGDVFGVQDRAAELVADLNTRLETLQAAAAGKGTAVVLVTNAGNLGTYGPASRLGWIFNDLGFQPLEENIDDRFHGGDAISFEYVLERNPDYIFVVDRDAGVGDNTGAAAALLDNDLVNQTTAAQNGHIIYLDPYSAYITFGGYNALVTLTDQILAGIQ